MDEPDLASLRSRREDVDRGLWWGKEGQFPASLPARRFHIIGVGLPKTGTTSLASLFQPFRWGMEFLFAESVARLLAWKGGRLGHERMRRWLALRAEAGALEMDSASFNHNFLEILVEMHPAAHFVYTHRDPVSWTDSFLNMTLRQGKQHGVREWPLWQVGLGSLMAPSFDPELFVSPERLRLSLRPLAEELLGYYARETARIEAALPPERSLVIPTEDLSTSFDTLAEFVGVPKAALNEAGSHAGRSQGNIPLVAALPDLPHLLERNGLGAAYPLP